MNSGRNGRLVAILKKLPSLFFGLFLFAAGIVTNLYSNLGMNPWGVLNVGLANHIPLTLGQVSQLIGLLVIVLGWLLGITPGLGTLANMFFVGYFMDLIISWRFLSVPDSFIWQMAFVILSVALLGIGSFFYLRVQLGAGPRDGLMLGLVRRMGRSVWVVRCAMESTVLVLGHLMGGPVGIGTVVTALTVGYSVQFAFRIGRFDSKSPQSNLYDLYRLLNGKNSRD